MIRLTPAMRTARSRLGMLLTMALGSVAIRRDVVLAQRGSARRIGRCRAASGSDRPRLSDRTGAGTPRRGRWQGLQWTCLERVSRSRICRTRRRTATCPVSRPGCVFRVLTSKADELAALEAQIAALGPQIDAALQKATRFCRGMRELTSRPAACSNVGDLCEESVRLAGLIASLRQLSVSHRSLIVRRATSCIGGASGTRRVDGRDPGNAGVDN